MQQDEIFNKISSPLQLQMESTDNNTITKKAPSPFMNSIKPISNDLSDSEDQYFPLSLTPFNKDFNLTSLDHNKDQSFFHKRHQSIQGKWVYTDQRSKAKWDMTADRANSAEMTNFKKIKKKRNSAFRVGENLPKIAGSELSKPTTDNIMVKIAQQNIRQIQNPSQISTDVDRQYTVTRSQIRSRNDILQERMQIIQQNITNNSEMAHLINKRPDGNVTPSRLSRLPPPPKSSEHNEYNQNIMKLISNQPKTPQGKIHKKIISFQNSPNFYHGTTDSPDENQQIEETVETNRIKDFNNLPKMYNKLNPIDKRTKNYTNNTNMDIQIAPMKFIQLSNFGNNLNESQEIKEISKRAASKRLAYKKQVILSDPTQMTNRETIDKSYKSPQLNKQKKSKLEQSIGIYADHLKKKGKNNEIGLNQYLQMQMPNKNKQKEIQEIKRKITEKKKNGEEKKKLKKVLQKKQFIADVQNILFNSPNMNDKAQRDTSRDILGIPTTPKTEINTIKEEELNSNRYNNDLRDSMNEQLAPQNSNTIEEMVDDSNLESILESSQIVGQINEEKALGRLVESSTAENVEEKQNDDEDEGLSGQQEDLEKNENLVEMDSQVLNENLEEQELDKNENLEKIENIEKIEYVEIEKQDSQQNENLEKQEQKQDLEQNQNIEKSVQNQDSNSNIEQQQQQVEEKSNVESVREAEGLAKEEPLNNNEDQQEAQQLIKQPEIQEQLQNKSEQKQKESANKIQILKYYDQKQEIDTQVQPKKADLIKDKPKIQIIKDKQETKPSSKRYKELPSKSSKSSDKKEIKSNYQFRIKPELSITITDEKSEEIQQNEELPSKRVKPKVEKKLSTRVRFKNDQIKDDQDPKSVTIAKTSKRKMTIKSRNAKQLQDNKATLEPLLQEEKKLDTKSDDLIISQTVSSGRLSSMSSSSAVEQRYELQTPQLKPQKLMTPTKEQQTSFFSNKNQQVEDLMNQTYESGEAMIDASKKQMENYIESTIKTSKSKRGKNRKENNNRDIPGSLQQSKKSSKREMTENSLDNKSRKSPKCQRKAIEESLDNKSRKSPKSQRKIAENSLDSKNKESVKSQRKVIQSSLDKKSKESSKSQRKVLQSSQDKKSLKSRKSQRKAIEESFDNTSIKSILKSPRKISESSVDNKSRKSPRKITESSEKESKRHLSVSPSIQEKQSKKSNNKSLPPTSRDNQTRRDSITNKSNLSKVKDKKSTKQPSKDRAGSQEEPKDNKKNESKSKKNSKKVNPKQKVSQKQMQNSESKTATQVSQTVESDRPITPFKLPNQQEEITNTVESKATLQTVDKPKLTKEASKKSSNKKDTESKSSNVRATESKSTKRGKEPKNIPTGRASSKNIKGDKTSPSAQPSSKNLVNKTNTPTAANKPSPKNLQTPSAKNSPAVQDKPSSRLTKQSSKVIPTGKASSKNQGSKQKSKENSKPRLNETQGSQDNFGGRETPEMKADKKPGKKGASKDAAKKGKSKKGKDLSKEFRIQIDDIIKPFKYMFDYKKKTLDTFWKKYDKDNSLLLSAKEFVPAVKAILSIEVTKQEHGMLAATIKSRFDRTEIKKKEFQQFMDSKQERKFDEKKIKKIKQDIKELVGILEEHGMSDEPLSVNTFSTSNLLAKNEQNLNLVYQRTFKLFLNSFNVFDQTQIDNMNMYVDKKDDGMIDLENVRDAMENPDEYSPYPGIPAKPQKVNTSKNEKDIESQILSSIELTNLRTSKKYMSQVQIETKDMGCNPIEFTPPQVQEAEEEIEVPTGKVSKHKKSILELRNEVDDDWYRSGLYQLVQDINGLPRQGKVEMTKLLEKQFHDPALLDIFTEQEAQYNATLLKQRFRRGRESNVIPRGDQMVLEQLYKKAIQTIDKLSEHLLLSVNQEDDSQTIDGITLDNTSSPTIRTHRTSVILINNVYKKVNLESTMKLLLRCKKLYVAMFEVKKILNLIIKQEQMFHREDGMFADIFVKYAKEGTEISEEDEATILKGIQGLQRVSRRIVQFQQDHKLFKSFKFNNNEHQNTLLNHAHRLSKIFRAQKSSYGTQYPTLDNEGLLIFIETYITDEGQVVLKQSTQTEDNTSPFRQGAHNIAFLSKEDQDKVIKALQKLYNIQVEDGRRQKLQQERDEYNIFRQQRDMFPIISQFDEKIYSQKHLPRYTDQLNQDSSIELSSCGSQKSLNTENLAPAGRIVNQKIQQQSKSTFQMGVPDKIPKQQLIIENLNTNSEESEDQLNDSQMPNSEQRDEQIKIPDYIHGKKDQSKFKKIDYIQRKDSGFGRRSTFRAEKEGGINPETKSMIDQRNILVIEPKLSSFDQDLDSLASFPQTTQNRRHTINSEVGMTIQSGLNVEDMKSRIKESEKESEGGQSHVSQTTRINVEGTDYHIDQQKAILKQLLNESNPLYTIGYPQLQNQNIEQAVLEQPQIYQEDNEQNQEQKLTINIDQNDETSNSQQQVGSHAYSHEQMKTHSDVSEQANQSQRVMVVEISDMEKQDQDQISINTMRQEDINQQQIYPNHFRDSSRYDDEISIQTTRVRDKTVNKQQ